jgi:hypothetical protein
MEKIDYRYRFWYRYRPKFMVSDWYRIEPKKAGIAHHYRFYILNSRPDMKSWIRNLNLQENSRPTSPFRLENAARL